MHDLSGGLGWVQLPSLDPSLGLDQGEPPTSRACLWNLDLPEQGCGSEGEGPGKGLQGPAWCWGVHWVVLCQTTRCHFHFKGTHWLELSPILPVLKTHQPQENLTFLRAPRHWMPGQELLPKPELKLPGAP
jgi:hypothetical protein